MVTTNKKGLTPPLSPAFGLSNEHDLSKISPAYYQELQETFNLFDTERKNVLSMKKMRLAMRTLGFEASLEDIEEIVQGMPELSVNLAKRKKKNLKQSKKGKEKQNSKESSSKIQEDGPSGTRRSSRTAAAASRNTSKSKYVDSDGIESSEEDDDGDNYEGGRDNESGDEADNNNGTEPFFTLHDFITIMTPGEEEHSQIEISQVFQLFDLQGKGKIRIEDLRRIAVELSIPMKDEELREMIEEADRDGDGAVTEQEFAKIMKKTGF